MFLATVIPTFIYGPADLPNKVPENLKLDNCALLHFVSVDMLLTKAFIILVLILFLEIVTVFLISSL